MATLGGSGTPEGLAEAGFGIAQQTVFWPPNETEKTSGVANLGDVFDKYCFKCRLEHHLNTERSKTSFCSPPSGTSSGCCCCCHPSCPPLRQLEIHVSAFELCARTWSGPLLLITWVGFIHLPFFCQTPCCAELKMLYAYESKSV